MNSYWKAPGPSGSWAFTMAPTGYEAKRNILEFQGLDGLYFDGGIEFYVIEISRENYRKAFEVAKWQAKVEGGKEVPVYKNTFEVRIKDMLDI